ncbi:hypothetical protein AAMO2058_000540100, partial [Amorphochlora amoebiformis]
MFVRRYRNRDRIINSENYCSFRKQPALDSDHTSKRGPNPMLPLLPRVRRAPVSTKTTRVVFSFCLAAVVLLGCALAHRASPLATPVRTPRASTGLLATKPVLRRPYAPNSRQGSSISHRQRVEEQRKGFNTGSRVAAPSTFDGTTPVPNPGSRGTVAVIGAGLAGLSTA